MSAFHAAALILALMCAGTSARCIIVYSNPFLLQALLDGIWLDTNISLTALELRRGLGAAALALTVMALLLFRYATAAITA